MPETPTSEGGQAVSSLEDLSEVHSFYLYLLEHSIGHEIPVPHQISHDPESLLHFVLLLDMAVTPQMIRNGFKIQEHRNAAGALLRFYALKPQRRREERDKADVIATTLFRTVFSEQEALRGESNCVNDFQMLLVRIYGTITLAQPPSEHLQLVRRFDILRREVQTFQTFDELIDSNVMQRVRAIKQTLHPSFLHPSVLAVVAHYNVCFHSVFDRLFAEAANHMRSFAAKLQEDGSSILGEMEDAGQLARMKNADLVDDGVPLQTPMRRLANVRRTIENDRRAERTNSVTVPAHAAEPLPAEPNGYNTPTSTVSAGEAENKEWEAVKVTIRSFVRTADPQAGRIVPLPSGNIELTKAEMEAFQADYGDERSFRADCAASLVSMASLDARLCAHLQEFERTKESPYNWKAHADALAHLLSVGRNIATSSMDLAATARQRGLKEKSDALYESIEKLRPNGRAAVEALQSISTGELSKTQAASA